MDGKSLALSGVGGTNWHEQGNWSMEFTYRVVRHRTAGLWVSLHDFCLCFFFLWKSCLCLYGGSRSWVKMLFTVNKLRNEWLSALSMILMATWFQDVVNFLQGNRAVFYFALFGNRNLNLVFWTEWSRVVSTEGIILLPFWTEDIRIYHWILCSSAGSRLLIVSHSRKA